MTGPFVFVAGLSVAAIAFIVLLLPLLIWVYGLMLRYVIEFWASKYRNTCVRVPIPSFLLGVVFCVSWFIIPIFSDISLLAMWLVTWILSFFIDNPNYSRGNKPTSV